MISKLFKPEKPTVGNIVIWGFSMFAIIDTRRDEALIYRVPGHGVEHLYNNVTHHQLRVVKADDCVCLRASPALADWSEYVVWLRDAVTDLRIDKKYITYVESQWWIKDAYTPVVEEMAEDH